MHDNRSRTATGPALRQNRGRVRHLSRVGPGLFGPTSGDLSVPARLGTRRRWRRCLFALAAGLFFRLTPLFHHPPGILLGGLTTVIVGLAAGCVFCLPTLLVHPAGILLSGVAPIVIGLTAGRLLCLTALLLHPAGTILGGAALVIIGLTALLVLRPASLFLQATSSLLRFPPAAEILIGGARRWGLDHRRPFITAAFLLEPAAIFLGPAPRILSATPVFFRTIMVTTFTLPTGAVAFPFAAATLMFPIDLLTALFPEIGIPPRPVTLHLPDQPVIFGVAEPVIGIAAATTAIARIIPDHGTGRPAAAGDRRQTGRRGGQQRHQFQSLRRGQGAGGRIRGGIAGADAAEFVHAPAGQGHVGPDIGGQRRQFQNQPQLFRRLVRRQGTAGKARIGIAHADQAQFRQPPGTGGNLSVTHLPILDGGIDSAGTEAQKQGSGERDGQETVSHDYWPRKAVTGAIRRLPHLACHGWRNLDGTKAFLG